MLLIFYFLINFININYFFNLNNFLKNTLNYENKKLMKISKSQFFPNMNPENNLYKNKVYLHLEKFNTRFNLIHIGISFENDFKSIRFDYRPFNYGNSYLIEEKNRKNRQILYPHLNQCSKLNYLLIEDNYTIESFNKKKIFWGATNKTQEEIIEFEKNYLLYKKYRVGIYDCRHFVNQLSLFSLDKSTPIWKLKNLF